jgi:hypothetical protein
MDNKPMAYHTPPTNVVVKTVAPRSNIKMMIVRTVISKRRGG